MSEFPEVGARIRAAREAQGRSLRSVARELDVSASLVSQIETGKLRPSVRTLYQIVNLLDLSVDELLQTPKAKADMVDDQASPREIESSPPVQAAADNMRLELTTGVVWERLADGGNPGLDHLLVTYGPHASSSSDGTAQRHGGWEFAYIVSGALTLFLDDRDQFTLQAGDSLSFDSRRAHHYYNPLDVESRAIFVITHDSRSRPFTDLAASSGRSADAPPGALTRSRLPTGE